MVSFVWLLLFLMFAHTHICTDGSRIVTGALDSNAIVWNLNDLTKRIEIKRAHPLGVCAVAFVDNDTIITGGHDATVRTWTLA